MVVMFLSNVTLASFVNNFNFDVVSAYCFTIQLPTVEQTVLP